MNVLKTAAGKMLPGAFLGLVFMLIASVPCLALELSFFIGDVGIVRNGKAITPELKLIVATGDVVITGKGGIAVLSYSDGSEIKVLEKSRVRIGSLAVKGSDDVSVITGNINAKFKKMARGGERKVYTPTTVCSVRGTDFLVGVSDTADSRIDLAQGKVNVRNPYGEIRLKENQKSEIGLGKAPEKSDTKTPMNEWKEAGDRELDRDPEGRGRKFKDYMNTLDNRSSKNTGELNGLNRKLSGRPSSKKDLEKTGTDIDKLQNTVVDDMFLCEAAGSSIDGVLKRFQKDKAEIYNTYLKIKEESNKVLEQQRRNYEAIEAVRQAYRKAYEEIMKGHKERMERIRGGMDKGSVKPEIKKK